MKTIAIVGGGFSGTMVLYHLMNQALREPVTVLVFDNAARHGRGVAYSTPMAEHLLNVPAIGMSALPDHRTHFMNWLKNDDGSIFHSRKRYGDYISTFLNRAVELAREKGNVVVLHAENVTYVQKAPLASGFAIATDEHKYPADIVILATGASQPRWPGGKEMPNDPRLIQNPYGSSFPATLERLHQRAKHIVILGTGLSAADAIMSLHHGGYTGKITCISRRGVFPVQHGLQKPWDWRRLIDMLRPHSNRLWRKMPHALRARLLAHVNIWNTVRHRMPRQCRAVLDDLRKRGQLSVLRGTVSDIACHEHSIDVVLKDGRTVDGDTVINCLGFIGAGVLGNPLYSGMAESGLLRVEDDILQPVSATSYKVSAAAPVYALGPPLFGYFIETTAVPELRQQALSVAKEVAAAL